MRRKIWLLKPTLSVKMHRKVRQKVKGGGTGVRVEQVWIFWQLVVPGANTDHTGRLSKMINSQRIFLGVIQAHHPHYR